MIFGFCKRNFPFAAHPQNMQIVISTRRLHLKILNGNEQRKNVTYRNNSHTLQISMLKRSVSVRVIVYISSIHLTPNDLLQSRLPFGLVFPVDFGTVGTPAAQIWKSPIGGVYYGCTCRWLLLCTPADKF